MARQPFGMTQTIFLEQEVDGEDREYTISCFTLPAVYFD